MVKQKIIHNYSHVLFTNQQKPKQTKNFPGLNVYFTNKLIKNLQKFMKKPKMMNNGFEEWVSIIKITKEIL